MLTSTTDTLGSPKNGHFYLSFLFIMRVANLVGKICIEVCGIKSVSPTSFFFTLLLSGNGVLQILRPSLSCFSYVCG